MKGIQNPIVPGWYADPEARSYAGKYWIYVTRSHTDYAGQLNLDAFSSSDLINWTKHEGIIDMAGFPWISKAVWAPTIIERGGAYYLVFASNDIQHDGEKGGLEIAVSSHPGGPFRGYLGRPLLDRFVNRAQPIDAHLFRDDDGTIYLYYGGWGHCNVARMNETMTGFSAFENGDRFLEITPSGYVEAPCMLKHNRRYYFMWSEGSWTDGTYKVAYGVGDDPVGPFESKGTLLEKQAPIADGPGHHSCLDLGKGEWVIVYHRRIIGEKTPGKRILCIDKLKLSDDGISRVVMTDQW